MNNKTVLITGAASGMAKAQTKVFLEQGQTVIGFDMDQKNLETLKKEFKELEGNLITFTVDISNKKQIAHALESVYEKVDQIDILINTAGIFDKYEPILEMEEDTWDSIMEVNVKGIFLLSQAVAPKMIKQGKGVIINIASAAGLRQDGGGVAYTSSKHAVVGLTKRMSYELGEKGIRINAIAPGRITTSMNENTDDLIKDNLPAQRNGTVEEIAEFTRILASDKADYIHGQVISIDGGWTIL